MSRFLAKLPGEQNWREIELASQKEMNVFVGGRTDVFPLSMGIDLYMNDGILTEIGGQAFNLCLSHKTNVHPVFGNVFVASRDDFGEIIPLNGEQTKHLFATSHSMTLPSGLTVMHLCPGGIQLEQIEPLRMMGELLRDSEWTNNQSSYSEYSAVWTGEGNINHESNWK